MALSKFLNKFFHAKKAGLFKKILFFGVLGFLGLAILGVLLIFIFSRNLPSAEQIANHQVSESTKIYDRTNKILLYEISNGEKRTYIPLAEIPQHLKDATISIEDARFYTEPGFSIRGILRALLANFTSGEIVQGGSTITQQLARNVFLSAEQTLPRKIKELILAVQLNRNYPKDKILELYLNEIPYGATTYGVESASLAFFSKTTKELTLGESAILASIPKAPSYYSPWGTHQKELFARQKLVLKRMLELKKITQEDFDKASSEKIVFSPQDTTGIKAPHFVLYVQDYLVQKYGEDMVRAGGLRVVTTLDWKLQELAEKVVKEGAERNDELYKGKNASLVAEDPKTGQILALVGSRDYFDTENEGNFNVAIQGLRQPGSALKPFTYLMAMKAGYTPETVLFDVPTEFDASGNPSKSYRPENFDNFFRGPVSMRNALAQSVNIPAVKTLYLIGIPNLLDTLKSFGINTLTDPRRYGLSLTLGGGEVKLVEIVGAYSVLASDGVKQQQSTILEVKDNKNNVLEKYKESSQKVFESQPIRQINDILSDVSARSALYSGSLGLTQVPGHDVALKTGTSNDYRDAWVFGYTPSLVAGVWAGNNDNAAMQKRGSSILAALPIWHAFMSEALKNFEPEAFPRPESVTPSKPILAGNYLAGNQIHTILYFVDKSNPTGPYPANPEKDSQFSNWEKGVLDWARVNVPNFNSFNIPGSPLPSLENNPSSSANQPQIQILSPKAGDFVQSSIFVDAEIKSPALTITEINIFLNGDLIQKINNSFGNSYRLSTQITPQNLKSQNLLEVEVLTQDQNVKNKTSVILYK